MLGCLYVYSHLLSRVFADNKEFVKAHDIPYSHIQPTTNDVVTDTSNVAEAGTLTLEWCLLTQYTKNQTYCDLAVKSAKHIAQSVCASRDLDRFFRLTI